MEETFTLPVHFKGQEILQEFTFRKLGYTYKIFAQINGQQMLFEPDEEGSFRATLENPHEWPAQHHQSLDRGYIQAVIQKLTEAFK